MIPSASALPLPVPAPELADPALASGPDSRQADADAPSFASHLDQFMPLASSHRPDPLANRPPPAIARRDADNAPQNASLAVKTNANAQASSDAKDPTVTSPANSDAQTPDDANTAIDKPVRSSKENKEDKAESKNDDKAANMVQTAAVTSLAPVPLPLTPATLAITVGIVPVPVSVSVQQTDSKDARTSASVIPATAPISGASLSAYPLNLPGVPMDSRAVGQTAAPGVVNALPQNTVAPAHISLTPPLTLTAPKTNGIMGKAASTPETPGTTLSAPLNMPQMPAPAAPQTPANPGQQTTMKQAGTQTAALPAPAGNASHEAANTADTANAANGITVASGDENPAATKSADASTTEQHLGGIERLFTLGPNKATDTRPSQTVPQAAELETGQDNAPVPTLANAAALPVQNTVGRKQVPIPNAAYIHPTATANGVPVAALLSTAVPTLASGQNSAIATALVSATLAGGAKGQTNALLPMADGLRTSNGASASASAGVTAGANSSANTALIAAVGAQSQAGGDASADGENQADADNWEAASSAAENTTDSATQANPANPFTGARATGEPAAANAVTAPNGSSQIDRAHVVEQVTRHLESMRISNGEGEMRLRLAPQHLGNVQISVAAHQDGVIARIAVESAQVQQVMDGAKEHLRAGLEARGLRVSGVEVTVTPNLIGNDSAAFANQRGGQSGGERAETAPRSLRSVGSGQASGDSAAPVPMSAPVQHVSLARLDYRA